MKNRVFGVFLWILYLRQNVAARSLDLSLYRNEAIRRLKETPAPPNEDFEAFISIHNGRDYTTICWIQTTTLHFYLNGSINGYVEYSISLESSPEVPLENVDLPTEQYQISRSPQDIRILDFVTVNSSDEETMKVNKTAFCKSGNVYLREFEQVGKKQKVEVMLKSNDEEVEFKRIGESEGDVAGKENDHFGPRLLDVSLNNEMTPDDESEYGTASTGQNDDGISPRKLSEGIDTTSSNDTIPVRKFYQRGKALVPDFEPDEEEDESVTKKSVEEDSGETVDLTQTGTEQSEESDVSEAPTEIAFSPRRLDLPTAEKSEDQTSTNSSDCDNKKVQVKLSMNVDDDSKEKNMEKKFDLDLSKSASGKSDEEFDAKLASLIRDYYKKARRSCEGAPTL